MLNNFPQTLIILGPFSCKKNTQNIGCTLSKSKDGRSYENTWQCHHSCTKIELACSITGIQGGLDKITQFDFLCLWPFWAHCSFSSWVSDLLFYFLSAKWIVTTSVPHHPYSIPQWWQHQLLLSLPNQKKMNLLLGCISFPLGIDVKIIGHHRIWILCFCCWTFENNRLRVTRASLETQFSKHLVFCVRHS